MTLSKSKMLSDALIEEKGLFTIIEKSIEWYKRAGNNKSVLSKYSNPIEWFNYTSLQKINIKLYNAWNKYIDLADRDIKDFNKVDDVRELITQFLTVRGLNLEDYKSIPENIFFSTFKKNGLKSKQMEALLKLYA